MQFIHDRIVTQLHIHNKLICILSLLLLASTAIAVSPDNWEITLHLSQNDRTNDLSQFGVNEVADDGYDHQLDIPSPPIPPNGRYLRAVFYHPEWNVPGLTRFNDDIRAPFELWQEKSWRIAITSSSDGLVTVNFELPPDFSNGEFEVFCSYENQVVDVLAGEMIQFEFTGQDTLQVDCQRIPLVQNYQLQPQFFNLAGCSILPTDFEVSNLFSSIQSLVVVYSEDGGIYIPSLGLNTIGEVNVTRGLKVFTELPETWSIEGTSLPEETVYELVESRWNYLSHPYTEEFSIEESMSHISESLVIVQADNGNLWIPSLNLNTIGTLTPGQAYYVFPNESLTFQYTR